MPTLPEADQPYENLKKALKTEINEEAWELLYTTRSRPFDKPATGKIDYYSETSDLTIEPLFDIIKPLEFRWTYLFRHEF